MEPAAATVTTGALGPTSRVIRGVRDLSSALQRQSLLVAGVCLLADVAAFLSAGPVSQLRAQDWAVLLAVAAVDAALALPARYSGWVAVGHAVVGTMAIGVLGGSSPRGHGNGAGALVAAYRAGAWLRGGPATIALLALALGIGAEHLMRGGEVGGEGLFVQVLKDAVLPWLVGRYTTDRGAYIAELEQSAEKQRRDARAAVDHAVSEERSAIARDLHDGISHHVSAISVHAGAARLRLTAGDGADGIAQSLTAVEMASRSAMADLRRLLDLLHGDTTDGSRQPGLSNLEDLLDGVRGAGLPVRLSTHGAARPVPESLDIALYRITQEMLTNALRHGDGSLVEVDLRYEEAAVSLTACNGILSPAARSAPRHPSVERRRGARGLAGIRKRVAVFDGSVSYGPDLTGCRWETTATFPLAADA